MSTRRAEVLRVHTFAVDPTARYALPRRRHQGGPPMPGCSPIELYRTLRGTTIATALAADGGHQQDVLIALCKMQMIGIELVRRIVPADEVIIEQDETSTLSDLIGETHPPRRRRRGRALGTSGSGDD